VSRFRWTPPPKKPPNGWRRSTRSSLTSARIARSSCSIAWPRARGLAASHGPITPYVNTIAAHEQPPYPGDADLEARLSAALRWNALAMVVRANRAYCELGGHIASYASASDLFEVGFNHFFRAATGEGHDEGGSGGDLVYFQPHSSPAVYARAYLEGFLDEAHLKALPPRNRRARPVLVSASVADAQLLAVPDRLDGHRPDQRDLPGALHALPAASRPGGHREPHRVGLLRRR
jgi:hypothetical protein